MYSKRLKFYKDSSTAKCRGICRETVHIFVALGHSVKLFSSLMVQALNVRILLFWVRFFVLVYFFRVRLLYQESEPHLCVDNRYNVCLDDNATPYLAMTKKNCTIVIPGNQIMFSKGLEFS
jgi:hypothetical protein